MTGPRYDPDRGRWVLDDEPSPSPRGGTAVGRGDRPAGRHVGAPARQRRAEEPAIAGGGLPPDPGYAARPVPARDPRRDAADELLHASGPATGRRGAERQRADRIDHAPRHGHHRGPETSGPDGASTGPYAGGPRPADATLPGHAGTGRVHYGGRRRAGDDDIPRPGPDGDARGRHGVDGHDAGDGHPVDVDRTAARHGRAAEPDRARERIRPARRRRRPWVVGGVAAVAAAVGIGLVVLDGPVGGSGESRTDGAVAFAPSTGGDRPGAAPADPAAPPAAAQVAYEVTGSGSAETITVTRGTSVAQVSGAPLPWQQTYPVAGEPTDYSITAAGGSGRLTCRILVAGAVLVEQSADGAVSCTGRR